MVVRKVIGYKDGGTLQLVTVDESGQNEKTYCIDNRLRTTTKGKIYDGYPENDDSNLMGNQEEMKETILESMIRLDHYEEWMPRIKKYQTQTK